MAEQKPDRELQAELLGKPERASDITNPDDPILTRRDEQKLLDEANHVSPPTLAPAEISLEPLLTAGGQRRDTPVPFGVEAIALVRRHPIPAMLVAAGLAYLLTRRRNA